MARRRDWLIDKKIGAVIRMRRVKLGLSQTDRCYSVEGFERDAAAALCSYSTSIV